VTANPDGRWVTQQARNLLLPRKPLFQQRLPGAWSHRPGLLETVILLEPLDGRGGLGTVLSNLLKWGVFTEVVEHVREMSNRIPRRLAWVQDGQDKGDLGGLDRLFRHGALLA
jgi:hypothetical protein